MIDRIIRRETRREEEMRGEEKRRRQNTRVAFHTLFGALVYSERVRARARASLSDLLHSLSPIFTFLLAALFITGAIPRTVGPLDTKIYLFKLTCHIR